MSSDYQLNILSSHGVYSKPIASSELVTNLLFVPLARRLGSIPGMLVDSVQFGGFNVTWKVDITFYTN